MSLEFHYFIAFTSQSVHGSCSTGNTVWTLDQILEGLDQIRAIEEHILKALRSEEPTIMSVVITSFQLIKVKEVQEETVLA